MRALFRDIATTSGIGHGEWHTFAFRLQPSGPPATDVLLASDSSQTGGTLSQIGRRAPDVLGPDGVNELYVADGLDVRQLVRQGPPASAPARPGDVALQSQLAAATVSTVAASGAAVTLVDTSIATIHDITLTANCTLTFPPLSPGKKLLLFLNQDAVGSRLVTWPATAKWAGGVAPVLSTGANKQDLISFVTVRGVSWMGMVRGLDLR